MASLQLALASLLLACAPAVHANTVAVGPAAAPVAAPVPDTIVAPIEAPVADTFVAPVEVAAATPVAAPASAPVAPVSAVPAPPIRSGGSPEWPKCDFFSGNESHTILGIMAGEWTRKFGPANFDLILEKVDAPTKAILTEFDLGKPGHTLMVPLNEGKNFTDRKLRDVNTFLQFGVVPQLLTTEEATFIVRNHLINETITYSELQSITELGNTATYKSLGHTVWEFTNQGGGIKLVDRYDIGQGRTKGVLFIQADITNAKQGECPNAVFSVDGFIATPENVPLPPPPPAPVAPVQAPTATVRAPPANFTNPFAAPTPPAAPLTATPPAEEAAVVDQSASAPPHITAGALVALGAIFTTAAFLIA